MPDVQTATIRSFAVHLLRWVVKAEPDLRLRLGATRDGVLASKGPSRRAVN